MRATGLKAGDVILEVGGKPVTALDDVEKDRRSQGGGRKAVLLRVKSRRSDALRRDPGQQGLIRPSLMLRRGVRPACRRRSCLGARIPAQAIRSS